MFSPTNSSDHKSQSPARAGKRPQLACLCSSFVPLNLNTDAAAAPMRICVRASVQGWVTRGATHARAHTWLARTSRNYRIHRPAGVRSELDDEKIRLTVNDEASVLMNSLTPPPSPHTPPTTPLPVSMFTA